MDCFLSEGIETIFRIALTLLMIAKHELLLLDMEGVIKYFQVLLHHPNHKKLPVLLDFMPYRRHRLTISLLRGPGVYQIGWFSIFGFHQNLSTCNVCAGRADVYLDDLSR